MSALERWAIEFMAIAVVLGVIGIWWKVHNAGEQRAGAQACIQGTTETKQAAGAVVATDENAQAAQLRAVAEVYDAKLNALTGANADLARRLRDADTVRPRAVSSPGAAACQAAEQPGLSESESQARDRRDADLIAVLDACDANQARVEGIESAYNDWRERMLKKAGAPSAAAPASQP